MAYPSFPQLVGSSTQFNDGREVFRDQGGGLHSSTAYDTVKTSFLIKHVLSSADLATLIQFYKDNLNAAFSFTWVLDGSMYSCRFGQNALRYTPGAVYTEVTVALEEA